MYVEVLEREFILGFWVIKVGAKSCFISSIMMNLIFIDGATGNKVSAQYWDGMYEYNL